MRSDHLIPSSQSSLLDIEGPISSPTTTHCALITTTRHPGNEGNNSLSLSFVLPIVPPHTVPPGCRRHPAPELQTPLSRFPTCLIRHGKSP